MDELIHRYRVEKYQFDALGSFKGFLGVASFYSLDEAYTYINEQSNATYRIWDAERHTPIDDYLTGRD